MSLNLKAERDKEDMIENVRAVLGNDISENDIPALWRNEEIDREEDYSADYPIGGMVEPYDIWREGQLTRR